MDWFTGIINHADASHCEQARPHSDTQITAVRERRTTRTLDAAPFPTDVPPISSGAGSPVAARPRMDWPDRTCIWVDVTTGGRLGFSVTFHVKRRPCAPWVMQAFARPSH